MEAVLNCVSGDRCSVAPSKAFSLFCCSFIAFCFFSAYPINIRVQSPITQVGNSSGQETSILGENEVNDFSATCILKVYDPLYKTIKRHVHPNGLSRNCNTSFTPPTELVNGYLSVHPLRINEFDVCSASCVRYNNATSATADRISKNFTMSERVVMECDVIWTKCYNSTGGVEKFAHLQIMEHRYSWRIMRTDRLVTGVPNVPPQIDWSTVCNKYHDDDAVIFKEYEKMGYATMTAEDYYEGTLFSWPTCKGFRKQPTTHNIRPLINILRNETVHSYREENCIMVSRRTVDYTGMFIKAYKNRPKFGLTWLTVAHDDTALLFPEDDFYENFFKEHETALRDSFVFFMGDHGPRFGKTVNTELGKREVNNPFLIMTLPVALRQNKKLTDNLEENSMKLLTLFDVHATLVDILKFAPQSNFTDFNHTKVFEDNPNNVTSMLRPVDPLKKRNCGNLPISFQNCLCEHDKREISLPEVAKTVHEFMIKELNQLLDTHNTSLLCAKLEPDQVVSLFVIGSVKDNLFEIIFTAYPGYGEFKALAHYDVTNKQIARKGGVERLNAYGKSGECVMPFLKEFCFCLPSNSRSMMDKFSFLWKKNRM